MRSALILTLVLAAISLGHPAGAGVISQTGGPDGAFDYATFDAAHHRVLVTRGAGVMSFDTESHALTTLAPGARTHSVVLLPRGRVLITNGSANTVTIANGQTGTIEATIAVGMEPDAAVYDPASRTALVMNAHSGDISVIDPVRDRETMRIAVGGALEFAVSDGSGRSSSMSRTAMRSRLSIRCIAG